MLRRVASLTSVVQCRLLPSDAARQDVILIMVDKNLLLVSTIEKFPCLYNYNLQEYMKKDITEKAWNEVANQLSLTVAECKEKWRNLRYSLLRSLKPNPDGTNKKKYYLHKEMEFLIPFMKTKGGFSTHFDEEIDEELAVDINDVTSPQQQLYEYELISEHKPEPLNKRKRNLANVESFQSQFISENDNTRKLFLLGLLPEINALSEEQMKVFRRKVLDLLDDISGDVTIHFEGHRKNRIYVEDAQNYRHIKPEPADGDGHTVYSIN